MLAEYLFVYGTLKQTANQSRYAFLEPYTEFFAHASASGKLFLYEDAEFIYPGFVFDEMADSSVKGELYVITDAKPLFEKLDAYEGCTREDPLPHQYRREQVTVKTNVAFEHQAWTYVYNWQTTGLKEVVNGNFV